RPCRRPAADCAQREMPERMTQMMLNAGAWEAAFDAECERAARDGVVGGGLNRQGLPGRACSGLSLQVGPASFGQSDCRQKVVLNDGVPIIPVLVRNCPQTSRKEGPG